MARWLSLSGSASPVAAVRRWLGAAARPLSRVRARDDAAPDAYPDTVLVRIPPVAGRPPSSFRMYTRGGADQIARDLSKFGWHGFERPVPDVFARCVAATDGLVVDVGANTGFYALVAAHVSSATTVHAFEPYPEALRCLEENLQLNREAARRVETFPYAASDAPGKQLLYVPDPGHGLVETSCSLDGTFKERVVAEIPVGVITLDAHMEALGRPVVSVVKIDVEAMEHRVLAGAEKVLARDRPVVFLEVLPAGDPAAIEGIRRAHGYVGIRLRPESAAVGAPVAYDSEGWNQALVPEDKLDFVRGILADASLRTISDGAGA